MKRKATILFILAVSIILISCSASNNDDVQKSTLSDQSNTNTSSYSTETESNTASLPTDKSTTEALSADKSIDEKVDELMQKMSLHDKIGQLFIVTPVMLETGIRQKPEAGTQLTVKQSDMLSNYPVGGICFFSQNITDGTQIKQLISDLQSNSKYGLFISVDEEGGVVSRLGGKPGTGVSVFDSMEEIGKANDSRKAFDVGDTLGKEISALGFNLNFAPIADINTNPQNPVIGNRAFGSNAELVSPMVVEEVLGLQGQNVSACLKHFPGHGDTNDDTHTGFVISEATKERLNTVELKPFQAGITAGVDFVMVAHIELPNVTGNNDPASMSKIIVTDILRNELGFDGIIITDALDMDAISKYYDSGEVAIKCLNAGIDVLLMPKNFPEAYEAIERAVADGTLSESRIDESVRRILTVKYNRGIIR